jgi:hypothetical protein
MEYKLKWVNLRRERDPRKAFRMAIRVTGISDDWHGSTMGALVKSLEAPGTIVQPMQKSQTNSERYWVLLRVFL